MRRYWGILGLVALGCSPTTPPADAAAVDAAAIDVGTDAGAARIDGGLDASVAPDAGQPLATCRDASSIALALGESRTLTVTLSTTNGDRLACGAASAGPQGAVWVDVPAGSETARLTARAHGPGSHVPLVTVASECTPTPTLCEPHLLAGPPVETFASLPVTRPSRALVVVEGGPADAGQDVTVTITLAPERPPTLTSVTARNVGSFVRFDVVGSDAEGDTLHVDVIRPVLHTLHDTVPTLHGATSFAGSFGYPDTGIPLEPTVDVIAVDLEGWTSATTTVNIDSAALVAFGDACDGAHACSPSLECVGGHCAHALGTSACTTVTAVAIDLSGATTPTVRTVDPVPADLSHEYGGPIFTTCAVTRMPQLFDVTIDAADLLLTATPHTGTVAVQGAIAVWDGECSDAASEVGCLRTTSASPIVAMLPAGSTTRHVWALAEPGSVGSIDLTFTRRPVRVSGAVCDPAGASDRCATGSCDGTGHCP